MANDPLSPVPPTGGPPGVNDPGTVAAQPASQSYRTDAATPRTSGEFRLTSDHMSKLAEAAKAKDPGLAMRQVWAGIHSENDALALMANQDILARERAQPQAAQDEPGSYISEADLAERTNGAINAQLLNPVLDMGNLASERLEYIAERQGPEAFAREVAKGHAGIIERSFGGREADWRQAVNQIDKAAHVIDPSGQLVQALAESGVMSDSAVFTRLQGLAQNILARRR